MVDLVKKFVEVFGQGEVKEYFSPGRINLIGEHTDYNGGFVFPAAITIGTFGVAKKREDNKVLLYSVNFEDLGVIEFDLEDDKYNKSHNWANYAKGVIKELRANGYDINSGFEVVINGTIPNGAGLSSSASLELLIGVILDDLFDLEVSRLELVQTGRRVENNFIGVNSGIMDQFAIGFGKKDCALHLNTNTLEYATVPVKLGDYAIVIMNTNKRRELADSKYNERRAECDEALKRLQTKLDIKNLCDLTVDEFEANRQLINDEILEKRAKHAIYENERTQIAKRELTNGNLETFGELLNASHASLKDDYEVTGVELDTLAETAQSQSGVLGARMTGAGFGGCAIAIVKLDEVSEFKTNVGSAYEEKIGYAPSFYVAHTDDGSRVLTK